MAPPPANEHDPVVKSLSHQMLRTRLHQESPPRQESLLIPHTDPTSRTFPIRASFPIVVTCATDAPPARPPTQHLPRYAAATPAHQHNTCPATLLPRARARVLPPSLRVPPNMEARPSSARISWICVPSSLAASSRSFSTGRSTDVHSQAWGAGLRGLGGRLQRRTQSPTGPSPPPAHWDEKERTHCLVLGLVGKLPAAELGCRAFELLAVHVGALGLLRDER
jgi:hypothetical protein